jgi:hypothetical protein
MTRFSTIDGLFRPNYHVYDADVDVKIADPEIESPYRDENITRVKLLTDILKETKTYPEYREELNEAPEEDNAVVKVDNDGEVSITLKKLREDNS